MTGDGPDGPALAVSSPPSAPSAPLVSRGLVVAGLGVGVAMGGLFFLDGQAYG